MSLIKSSIRAIVGTVPPQFQTLRPIRFHSMNYWSERNTRPDYMSLSCSASTKMKATTLRAASVPCYGCLRLSRKVRG